MEGSDGHDQKYGDYVIISEPYEGFGAFKAGLIAGDKILEVDGQDVKGKNSSEQRLVVSLDTYTYEHGCNYWHICHLSIPIHYQCCSSYFELLFIKPIMYTMCCKSKLLVCRTLSSHHLHVLKK